MRHSPVFRGIILVATAAFFPALQVSAQDQQQPSVAEAARLNREQKKPAAKPAKVFTDDTLSKPSAAPSPNQPEGQPAPQTVSPAEPAAPAAETDSAASPAKPAADSEQVKAEIAALKQQVAEMKTQVELLQRLLALDQDALYSKPDYQRDKDGKAKLDAEQADLQAKQEELAQLKAKLAALAPPADTAKPEPK
jgi:hypothetical protein